MKNFNVITMPGGEQHVTLKNTEILESIMRPAVRVTGIVTAEKLIAALMACEVYARHHRYMADLVLPYFPGARQDREQGNVSVSAEVYARIIKSAYIHRLVILDIHSNAAKSYASMIFDNGYCDDIYFMDHYEWFLYWLSNQTFSNGPHKFLFPDAGALTKYSKQYPKDYMSCSKKRDPNTGALSGFEVPDLRKFAEDQFLWIVDDICDGGGTFIAIAKEVRRQLGNRCKLGLAVSHGIFSKGTLELCKLFDYIVTTDSVYDTDMGSIIDVQPLQPLLKEMGIYA